MHIINCEITRWKDKEGNLLDKDAIDALLGEKGEEHVLANYEETKISLEVTFSGRWVDEGIGSYEYWGFKGVDVDWQYEVEELDDVVDEDGNDWSDRITDSEYEEIVRQCEEYGEQETR